MVTARAAATFEPVGRSAAAARGFVRDALLGWGLTEVVDDAVVLVSELVTNAVVHAGTAADVCCLREDDAVRIEVTDRHPERGIPAFANVPAAGGDHFADPDGESGRGLLMCSALASRWGVEYSAGRKTVWFRLDLPEHTPGTRYALPSLPGGELPGTDGPVRVAVVQLDEHGLIRAWNADAEALFRHTAADTVGRPWSEYAQWPQSPGLGLTDTLRLARWEGGYAVRTTDATATDVYGVHIRMRDTHGAPTVLCLLVRGQDRAVLRSPATAADTPPALEPLDLLTGPVTPDDLSGLLQRIVERARDLLDGDAAYLLLTSEDETEFEVRASTGLAPAGRRLGRLPVDGGLGRFDSARLPAVHEDLAVRPHQPALLTDTGLRSLITVPLKVEGRLTGTLGVAAATPGRYDNEDALRLQFGADRIALALESARLAELERLRRGSLSFLVEASDLLAGTLEHEQTLALMAQMAVPTLAAWCAVYTTGDTGSGAAGTELAFLLHEDEDRIDPLRALLDKTPPPDADLGPGARPWPGPGDTAHALGLTDSPELTGLLGETVVLPLSARNRVIGLLVLGGSGSGRFRQEILELAEDLSRRAALALDNSRLYSERTATSQAFQRALLPPELPKIPGVEVEVFYQAAGEGNEVGGDFYDLFPIREGTYGFAIGDVCGTGPEAASVTGLARHSLRLLAREGLSAPQVLNRLNAAILDEGSRARFLTLLYGEMTPRQDGSTELSLVCAGHPLPLRLRADGQVDQAASPQPLLGVMDELDLEAEQLVLSPGEVLLCVTDGVTERREGSRMLGDEGLAEVLTGCTGLTAGAVAARVQRAVERFAAEPPSDDMAILTLRIPTQRQAQ